MKVPYPHDVGTAMPYGPKPLSLDHGRPETPVGRIHELYERQSVHLSKADNEEFERTTRGLSLAMALGRAQKGDKALSPEQIQDVVREHAAQSDQRRTVEKGTRQSHTHPIREKQIPPTLQNFRDLLTVTPSPRRRSRAPHNSPEQQRTRQFEETASPGSSSRQVGVFSRPPSPPQKRDIRGEHLEGPVSASRSQTEGSKSRWDWMKNLRLGDHQHFPY